MLWTSREKKKKKINAGVTPETPDDPEPAVACGRFPGQQSLENSTDIIILMGMSESPVCAVAEWC